MVPPGNGRESGAPGALDGTHVVPFALSVTARGLSLRWVRAGVPPIHGLRSSRGVTQDGMWKSTFEVATFPSLCLSYRVER